MSNIGFAPILSSSVSLKPKAVPIFLHFAA